MSTNVAKLKVVPKTPTTEKKKRQRIVLIETPPEPDWFVKTREHGRTVWYLRFRVTGMLPRRHGPFKNRHLALLALDSIINTLSDGTSEAEHASDAYRLKRRFHQRWGALIEDDLALPKEGRQTSR